ncbi:hypothetical protein NDU88_005387 [Pleurodeles waltl]|uniref:Uncharacterized protein n=1 Tax=Pleurodeles waltl TaxID=8319 RepID=A0AAV7MAD2_PLEWA|nr:hypothetical protein NDU88_005387 [Pleurodeles waltl]
MAGARPTSSKRPQMERQKPRKSVVAAPDEPFVHSLNQERKMRGTRSPLLAAGAQVARFPWIVPSSSLAFSGRPRSGRLSGRSLGGPRERHQVQAQLPGLA